MGICTSVEAPTENGEPINEAVVLIKPHCSQSKTFVEFVENALKENKVGGHKSQHQFQNIHPELTPVLTLPTAQNRQVWDLVRIRIESSRYR